MTGPVVMTAAGAVVGTPLEGAFAFKGVPYGAPTGHSARFLPPSPPVHWTEARDALSMARPAPSRSSPPARPSRTKSSWRSSPPAGSRSATTKTVSR